VYTIPWTTDNIRPEVKPGEVYKVVVSGVSCRSGFTHNRDELLVVCEKTNDFPPKGPYGEVEVGPYGYNWYVQTMHDYSVWSTLESCIERGMLKKV
jgi:hypothetical protein